MSSWYGWSQNSTFSNLNSSCAARSGSDICVSDADADHLWLLSSPFIKDDYWLKVQEFTSTCPKTTKSTCFCFEEPPPLFSLVYQDHTDLPVTSSSQIKIPYILPDVTAAVYPLLPFQGTAWMEPPHVTNTVHSDPGIQDPQHKALIKVLSIVNSSGKALSLVFSSNS